MSIHRKGNGELVLVLYTVPSKIDYQADRFLTQEDTVNSPDDWLSNSPSWRAFLGAPVGDEIRERE